MILSLVRNAAPIFLTQQRIGSRISQQVFDEADSGEKIYMAKGPKAKPKGKAYKNFNI